MLELRAVVHGRIQGVGFRATADKIAKQFHLKGFVKNTPQSTVEIIAQGERETLEKFLSSLKHNFSGYIDQIDIQFVNPTTQYQHFSIVF